MTLAFAPERIETWPLSRLVPYAKNAKVHGPDQVAKLAASMAEFGWTVPCLVGEDGELIAGHGRVLAATQLGLTEAPVIVLAHLSEAQRRACRIADNKLTELGSWDEALLSAELQDLLAEDFDLSLVGFSDGELDRLLAFDPGGGGEDEGGAGGSVPPVTIPEPPRNPASHIGDLWILGDHRLLCGGSTNRDDVRRLMNGERAVLFATDPPYLVDYDGTNHPTQNKDWSQSYGVTWDDSSQGAELYDGFIAAAVAEAITEDAAWYCWHASRRQAMLEACWEKAGAFVHQQIIWVKDRGVLTRSHYLWKHEPCFMGWRRPNRPPKVSDETLPSTWEMPSFTRDERPDYPTPKPLDAFGIPMRQHVARGGLCYEPFSGSGSQIMAGEANGRRVFAMEISPAYVDVAVERWQEETGREAILDGDGRSFAAVKAERLIVLGLTGSIGMGKSTTARMLREAGVPVHNSDETVHRLYAGAAAPLIEARFPGVTADGVVDREKLAKAVLGDSRALRDLEQIVHPLVHAEANAFLARHREEGAPLVLLDIPLLFETGGEARVDRIVVVTAPAEVQRERVLARPGMTEEKFEAILARQTPDAENRRRADFVIDTGLGIEAARAAVAEIVAELAGGEGARGAG